MYPVRGVTGIPSKQSDWGTQQCSHSYGFVRTSMDFLKNSIFVWIFSKIRMSGLLYGFFKNKDHFYRFYSLILLFCKLCECDAICSELCDDKYKKNLVSILFSCFFNVRLRFRRMDNLFFVEKNLIKVSRVPWKDFLLFFGSTVFLKSNFSLNFLKSLVQISIRFYLSIAQIFFIVYLKFLENFLIFVGCPHISFNISYHLNIFAIN